MSWKNLKLHLKIKKNNFWPIRRIKQRYHRIKKPWCGLQPISGNHIGFKPGKPIHCQFICIFYNNDGREHRTIDHTIEHPSVNAFINAFLKIGHNFWLKTQKKVFTLGPFYRCGDPAYQNWIFDELTPLNLNKTTTFHKLWILWP